MAEQVWAISMFKNEADIAQHAVKHMIDEGVDGIIIADNMSTDATLEQLHACESYAQERHVKLIIEVDEEVGHYQSKKMTAMVARAAALGANWIVPFDADELWYSKFGRMADTLKMLPPNITVAQCMMLDHFATSMDGSGGSPFENLQWCVPKYSDFPKIAYRWTPEVVIHEGNHGVDHANGEVINCLELRHFPYRSFEHVKDKAIKGKKAFDAAPELRPNIGVHWRLLWKILEEEGEQGLLDYYKQHFWFADPVASGLERNPAPFRQHQIK